MLDPLYSFLTRAYERALVRAPRTTVAITVLVLCAVAGAIVLDTRREARERAIRAAALQDYTARLAQLEQVQAGLRELTEFVAGQRQQLGQERQTIASLKSERDALLPLVQADRRTIDALFTAQELRNRKEQRRERWYGFGLGVLSSLGASVLWLLGTLVLKRWRQRKSGA
jgi:hypothetical protein